jgi:hypothetical protein
MARLSSASVYTEFHQASTQTFDPYMPTVVWGALLGGVALATLLPGPTSTAGGLAAAGVVWCYAAVMAISLLTGVRINRLIAGWSIDHPPADWALVRARWIRFHILRTLISIPALIAYLLSGILGGR